MGVTPQLLVAQWLVTGSRTPIMHKSSEAGETGQCMSSKANVSTSIEKKMAAIAPQAICLLTLASIPLTFGPAIDMAADAWLLPGSSSSCSRCRGEPVGRVGIYILQLLPLVFDFSFFVFRFLLSGRVSVGCAAVRRRLKVTLLSSFPAWQAMKSGIR